MDKNAGHVFSGVTQAIEANKFEKGWYFDLDEERTEWEILTESSSIKEFLGSLKIVPLYQYLMNYVYYWFYKKQLKHGITCEIQEELIKKTAAQFKENGMPEEKCKEEHIREILTTEWSREWDNFEKASTRRIFELAFGLKLPVEDVEELLKKAVKRAGFNYYDKEELLTFCVLRYQKKNQFLCFEALMRDFTKIKEETAAETEKKKSQTKEPVEIRENTMAVRSDLEAIMKGEIYKEDKFEYENLNESLKVFFRRCNAESSKGRTAAKVFEKLYQSVTDLYEEELMAYKNIYRGSEECAFTKLEIVYDASSEIKIPEESVFYAKKKMKKAETLAIEFESKKEMILPKLSVIEVVIPIRSCESQKVEKNKKAMKGYIKVGKELTLKTSESKEFQAMGECVYEIVTDTTVKYTGKEGEEAYAVGNLNAKAAPGLVIPEGTVFLYGEQEYISTKTVVAEAKAEIEVMSRTPHEPGKVVTKTNTINQMRDTIPGIWRISNPKPVKMNEATDTISKELFREFLYGYNVDNLKQSEKKEIKKLLGRWFTETEITSVRFSKIQKQAESKQGENKEKVDVRRSDIITLAFMKYCKEAEEYDFDGSVEGLEAAYMDFVDEVNEVLRACRMLPFYLTNLYERFLAYLLKTDTPVDSLRNTWMIVNAGRRNMDV